MAQHASTAHVHSRLGRLAWRVTATQIRLQEGQSTVEYAIVLALIAVATMAAVQALGAGVAGVFQRILSSIAGIG